MEWDRLAIHNMAINPTTRQVTINPVLVWHTFKHTVAHIIEYTVEYTIENTIEQCACITVIKNNLRSRTKESLSGVATSVEFRRESNDAAKA